MPEAKTDRTKRRDKSLIIAKDLAHTSVNDGTRRTKKKKKEREEPTEELNKYYQPT